MQKEEFKSLVKEIMLEIDMEDDDFESTPVIEDKFADLLQQLELLNSEKEDAIAKLKSLLVTGKLTDEYKQANNAAAHKRNAQIANIKQTLLTDFNLEL